MSKPMDHYEQIYEAARQCEITNVQRFGKISKDSKRPKPKYIDYNYMTGEYSYKGKIGEYFIYSTYIPCERYIIISSVYNINDSHTARSAYAKFYFTNEDFKVNINFSYFSSLKDENALVLFSRALSHAHEVCAEIKECHHYLVNFNSCGCGGVSC